MYKKQDKQKLFNGNIVSINYSVYFKLKMHGDFPGRPVVKTSPSNAGGAGSISGRRAKIPHALWPKSKTEAIL